MHVSAGGVGGALCILLIACTNDRAPDGDPPQVTASGTATISGELRQVDPLVHRAAHTATLLPGGEVLVIGGCVVDGCSEATPRTELFDSSTAVFTSGPELAQPRAGHTATALPNGDVLILGGYTGEGTRPLAAAELYVADRGEFVPAGTMATGRGGHAAALLADGRVLAVGGWLGDAFTDTVEIWDPETRSFSAVRPLPSARGSVTATPLPDGRVLIAGGEAEQGTGLDTVELYDPDENSWRAGPSLAHPRLKHAAVALESGEVLVVGGTPDDRELVADVERFDGEEFRAAGTLTEGRYKLVDAVVTLPDGRVLLAGGGETAEAYDPATETAATIAGTEGSRSSFTTATVLETGDVLVVGGYDEAIDLRREAYVLGGLTPA